MGVFTSCQDSLRGTEGRIADSEQCVRGAKLMRKPSINLCGSLAAHSARASGWITAMLAEDSAI